MKGLDGNGFVPIIAQAIAEMEETHGEFKSIDEINLAELSRRTGLSRAKLRRLKANGFCEVPHGLTGQQRPQILDGYSAVLDSMLRSGVSNSAVCLERLQEMGFNVFRKWASPGAVVPLNVTSPRTSIFCRPSASRSHRRATAVAVT